MKQLPLILLPVGLSLLAANGCVPPAMPAEPPAATSPDDSKEPSNTAAASSSSAAATGPAADALASEKRAHTTIAGEPVVFVDNSILIDAKQFQVNLQQSWEKGAGPDHGHVEVWAMGNGRPVKGKPLSVEIQFVQVNDPTQPAAMGPARNISGACKGKGTVTFSSVPAIPKHWKGEAKLGAASVTVDYDVDCGGDHAKAMIGTDKFGKFKVTGDANDVPVTTVKP